MNKYLISFILLFSFNAFAETRLTTNLDWQHQPRSDYDLAVFMTSKIPNGSISFRRWNSGQQTVDIEFDDGRVCSTSNSKMILLTLKCGYKGGFYWFSKRPSSNGQLEWVTQ